MSTSSNLLDNIYEIHIIDISVRSYYKNRIDLIITPINILIYNNRADQDLVNILFIKPSSILAYSFKLYQLYYFKVVYHTGTFIQAILVLFHL